jgi:uncharacterized protein YvpB
MKINLCPTRDKHYSQLNNEIEPYNTCQVTSMVAGLDISGIGLDPIYCFGQEKYKQPEDKLKFYIENDLIVQDYYKRYFNVNIPAPEWAGVMVYAINQLYKKNTVYYDDYLDADDINEDLQNGLPIYTSMKYPENKNFSGKPSPVPGHIVLIVGIDEENIIINDPYKNHLTGDKDGFNNLYTMDEFKAHNKGYAIRYRR